MEDNLRTAFESGFSNAALSLSKMTNDKIQIANFSFGFYSLDSGDLQQNILLSRIGEHRLITTEVFGDFVGKSYLLISQHEFDSLTSCVPDGKNGANLKEEYIKELDNILSASVITHLSNQLKRKMYGDVPNLIPRVSSKIADIIYDDFSEQTTEVYINAINFTFENKSLVTPYFIWVIDSSSVKVAVTEIK